MRIPTEIAHRCRTAPVLEREVLLDFLPWAYAQAFCTAAVTERQWNRAATAHDPGRPRPLNRKVCETGLRKALYRGWEHALAHRRMPVGAAILHCQAWLWLIGHDTLVDQITADHWPFAPFGGPILGAIGDHVGLGPATEIGDWAPRMARGQTCMDGCHICGAMIAEGITS